MLASYVTENVEKCLLAAPLLTINDHNEYIRQSVWKRNVTATGGTEKEFAFENFHYTLHLIMA